VHVYAVFVVPTTRDDIPSIFNSTFSSIFLTRMEDSKSKIARKNFSFKFNYRFKRTAKE